MRLRAVVFIVVGTLAGIAGTAYAATAAPAGSGETGIVMISMVALSGVSQLGAVLYLLRLYRDKVDASAKAIPDLVAALQIHKAAMESHAESEKAVLEAHTKSIEELYNSRNDQGENLTEINVLHEILGCKDRLKELAAELRVKTGGSHAA